MADSEIIELLNSLARFPADMTLLIAELPAGAATLKQSADEFSVLENICHLRDIEVEGYGVRIERILNQDHPFLSDIDGSRLAIERDYNRQSLSEAMLMFTSARRRNVGVLEAATDSEWEREGELEGVGVLSLRRLLEMMSEHDEGHLEDLSRLLRISRLGT